MNGAIILALTAAVAVVLFFVVRRAGKVWAANRGPRVVECPETGRPAAVDIDTGHAVRSALTGDPEIRLATCTRWPDRSACGQECLTQIADSPSDCSLKTILAHWYLGADCALCGATFETLHWHDHRPGLLSPDNKPLDWTDFRAEDVRDVLETHRPICWNCHMTETFRRRHGDRVVDRGRSALR